MSLQLYGNIKLREGPTERPVERDGPEFGLPVEVNGVVDVVNNIDCGEREIGVSVGYDA